MLLIFNVAFLCFFSLVFGRNLITNGDFESGKSGWTDENSLCSIDKTVKYSGTQSMHCKAKKDGNVGFYKILYRSSNYNASNVYIPGMKYKLEAKIKFKSVAKNSDVLAFMEAAWYTDGLYYTNRTKEEWISVSYTSIYFSNKVNPYYILGFSLRNVKAGDEMWVDDVVLTITDLNLLIGVDVKKWKQELEPDEKVDVVFNIDGDRSGFENGTFIDATLNVFDANKVKVYTDKNFTMKFSYGKFVIDSNLFKKGYHLVQVILKNLITGKMEHKTTKFKKLDKKIVRKFFVDGKNRLIHNGKPFFPFGIYLDYFNVSDFDYWKDSKVNVIVEPGTYNGILDITWKKSNQKIYVLRSLTNYDGCGGPLPKSQYERQKKIALESRDHEALMGYYVANEPHICVTPRIRNRTLTIRSYDYHHLTWPAFCQYYNLGVYKEAVDVGGIDIYPMSKIDELNAVWASSKTGKRLAQNNRAFFDIPQIFDWYLEDPQKFANERPPTEQEMKQMSWQFISTGANGLIYFCYTSLQYNDKRYPFIKEWQKFKNTMDEVDKYKDIILTHEDNNPNYWFPQENGGGYDFLVGRRLFRYQRFDYVLIVNIYKKNQKYSFIVPEGVKKENIEILQGASSWTFDEKTHRLAFPTLVSMDVIWVKIYDPNYTVLTPEPVYSTDYTPNPEVSTVEEDPDIDWVPTIEGKVPQSNIY